MEGLVEYASSDDENASEQPVKESVFEDDELTLERHSLTTIVAADFIIP